MNEFGMFAKTAANELDINPNTLRRWCLDLEKQGYEFERNEKDQRIFYERDVNALYKLKKLLDQNVGMENATKAVVIQVEDKKNAEKTLSVITENNEKNALTSTELEKIVENAVQKAIQEEREVMFKAFEQKLNDVVESRDRVLMQSLNQTLESKRLEIAAAKVEEEEKKGFRFWFWRKQG